LGGEVKRYLGGIERNFPQGYFYTSQVLGYRGGGQKTLNVVLFSKGESSQGGLRGFEIS